jgi:hypothetical protein
MQLTRLSDTGKIYESLHKIVAQIEGWLRSPVGSRVPLTYMLS